jgi:hypothetical protein
VIPARTWNETIALPTFQWIPDVAAAMITARTVPPIIVPRTLLRGFILVFSLMDIVFIAAYFRPILGTIAKMNGGS